jgi:isoleucyl-tRNA synthetase
VDILLHPICPYITEKLYQECFSDKKECILIEEIPPIRSELISEEVERKFQTMDKINSEINSLRMKAKLKRRWPVDRVVVVFEKMEEFTDREREILRENLNVKHLDITDDPSSAPIQYNLRPNMQALGKKLKGDLPNLLKYLEKTDTAKLSKALMRKKTVILKLGKKKIKLEQDDFQYFLEPKRGYALAEAPGMKICMNTKRDQKLIREGTLRDIARRIQAYRKEKGLNPIQVVKEVKIWSDDKELMDTVREKGEELRFLVRSEKVNIAREYGGDWKRQEVDDKVLMIYIEA